MCPLDKERSNLLKICVLTEHAPFLKMFLFVVCFVKVLFINSSHQKEGNIVVIIYSYAMVLMVQPTLVYM